MTVWNPFEITYEIVEPPGIVTLPSESTLIYDTLYLPKIRWGHFTFVNRRIVPVKNGLHSFACMSESIIITPFSACVDRTATGGRLSKIQ
jgi:hypothetical protein